MKRYLPILLFVAALQYSRAQPAHLSFDRLDTQTGLPENNVADIIQDSQGYIWLTTQNGMVRYDGYNVKIYKPGIEDKSNAPNYLFYKILQDKNHDLWVCGGNTGLFKYDRTADRFVQYKNKSGDIKGFSRLLGIDGAGKIWYTIDRQGLSSILQQFNPATGLFKSYGQDQKGAHRLNCKSVDAYIDHQGKAWFVTDNGFYLYNPSTDSFRTYLAAADTSQQKTISLLYQARETPGKLWVAVQNKNDKRSYLLNMDTQSGRTEKFEHLAADKNSLGNDTVNTAFEDSRGRLWLGTYSGLSLYNAKTKGFINYQPEDTIKSKYKNYIGQIVAGKDGLLWLASGYGLLCFNPETGAFKRYAHDKDDPGSLGTNNYASKLLFDRDGTLWLGLYFGGAAHVNLAKSAFINLNGQVNKFPWHGINNVREAPDNAWWVGAENGLYRYDRFKKTIKLIDKNIALGSFAARNGLIYYGWYNPSNSEQGLRVYDPQTGKTAQYQANAKDSATLSNNNITSILEDHTGIVWIGTGGGGICAFNPGAKKFKRYPYIFNDNTKISRNMLDDSYVETIYEDKAGTVWVGTNHGGVNHFDRKRDLFISSYKPREGVFCISAFSQDHSGRLWAGTYLNGMFLLDGKTGAPLKRLTQKDGLLSDQTFNDAIHNGSGDCIWVCGPRGFSRISTRDFSLKNYKTEDYNWAGIDANALQSAGEDGSIIFWSDDDISLFNPNAIATDVNPPVVHIETMTYNDRRAATDSTTTIQTYGRPRQVLPWNQNKVTFNYVALHYIDPKGTIYAYRLQGYDNHWIQAGNQRSATYNNLAPGTYTFLVKAANSDGVWNNKGDSFILIINPPWWQTWWAWILWIALFVSAVYVFIAYRSRKLLRDKKVLEHKVLVRTEEVMQQKEEIESQRDSLETTLGDLRAAQSQLIQSEKMASLGELTAGIAHEIQNPLNFVNNFSEVNKELLADLKQELAAQNYEEVSAIADDIIGNEDKINHHGKRAEFIVKGMLEHSRTNTGEKQSTDMNVLCDEFLKLSYHGLRAKDKSFNAEMIMHFDTALPKVNVSQQDMGRVMLNLFNNAFYAVNQKAKIAGADYKPEVIVATAAENGQLAVSVRDNGAGIPEGIKDKIMQPFFTTKPTGEGTGLGLSLTYDMVVKGHGGTINVNTKEGEYTELIIMLPIAL